MANVPAKVPGTTIPALGGEAGLNRYLAEIRKFPLLSPEQEYMLAKRWAEHQDPEAAGSVTFSSTYIRSCVDAGDVVAAAEALGRPHRVEGVVVRGDGRGRVLGFPTANVAPPMHSAIPADGVYAAWFTVLPSANEPQGMVIGRRYQAAVSVGTNPTFSGRTRTVEAFVLDTEADLYGQHVAVDFVSRIRGQEKFDSVDDLVVAMDRDTQRARTILVPQ